MLTIMIVTTGSLVDPQAQDGGGPPATMTTTASARVTPTTTSVVPLPEPRPPTPEPQPATTTTVTSTAPGVGPASGVSRTSGNSPVLLADGTSLDLDSPEEDWGSRQEPDYTRVPGTDDNDLKYLWGNVSGQAGIASATARATLDDCVGASYVNFVTAYEIDPGSAFCVKTSSATYARILVIAKGTAQFTLDIVVWQPRR